MSRGIGGSCRMIAKNGRTVTYAYGGYNLNDPQYRNEEKVCAGVIRIDESELVSPALHERLSTMPCGQKKHLIRRALKNVPYASLIGDGRVRIDNCSNCWQCLPTGTDMIAYGLLLEILGAYEREGFMPLRISYGV